MFGFLGLSPEVVLKLKSQLKDYEHTRKVRVDFLTAQTELPDYTEDFLNHLETADEE